MIWSISCFVKKQMASIPTVVLIIFVWNLSNYQVKDLLDLCEWIFFKVIFCLCFKLYCTYTRKHTHTKLTHTHTYTRTQKEKLQICSDCKSLSVTFNQFSIYIKRQAYAYRVKKACVYKAATKVKGQKIISTKNCSYSLLVTDCSTNKHLKVL